VGLVLIGIIGNYYSCNPSSRCCKWVPVTTALHVLGLRMEEWPLVWRVAANILNKQLQTADKGWTSSLGVGRGANNSL
jgi:hypothetical protein